MTNFILPREEDNLFFEDLKILIVEVLSSEFEQNWAFWYKVLKLWDIIRDLIRSPKIDGAKKLCLHNVLYQHNCASVIIMVL